MIKSIAQTYYDFDFILSVKVLIDTFKIYCDKHNKQYIDNNILIGKGQYKLILNYKQL